MGIAAWSAPALRTVEVDEASGLHPDPRLLAQCRVRAHRDHRSRGRLRCHRVEGTRADFRDYLEGRRVTHERHHQGRPVCPSGPAPRSWPRSPPKKAEAAETESAEQAGALDVPLHLRIDRELDAQLRSRALAEQIPTSALVRRLLRQAIGEQRSSELTAAEVEQIARRVVRVELHRTS